MRAALILLAGLTLVSCARAAIRSQLRATPFVTSDGPQGAARVRSGFAVVRDLPGDIAAFQAQATVGRYPSGADEYRIGFFSASDSPHDTCGSIYIGLDGERLPFDTARPDLDATLAWVGERIVLSVSRSDLTRMTQAESVSARWCGTSLETDDVPDSIRAMLEEIPVARARAAILP